MYRRLACLASLLTALLASGCQKPHPAHARAATPAPKLVVMIVIDQLPSWKFSQDQRYAKAGLRRLIDRGTYFEKGRFPYANTSTAPGHATLGSGAPPKVHGILGNYWYEEGSDQRKDSIEDETQPLFQLGPNPSKTPGASSRRLRVEGVGDVLKRERPGSKVIAVALKDRSAILMLGKKPDLAVFYDEDQPAFTTTRFYVDAPPAWVVDFNKSHAIESYAGKVWEPLDRKLVASATGVIDDLPGEGADFSGLDRTFPHPLGGPELGKAIASTPWGTDLVFDLAETAITNNQLGQDDIPDLLGVGVSSHDIAGHVWGQESWERFDLFLRLDQRLGAFLEFLDKTVGPRNYVIVVTGDHGATPLVELSQSLGKDAHRVTTQSIVAAGEAAAKKILGPGEYVRGLTANTLYVTPAFEKQPAAKREQALDAMVVAVRKLPGIGFADRTDRLAGDCEKREGIAAAACWTLDPRHSGPVFVSAAPLSILAPAGYETGTNHGSATDEDSEVPIILYQAGAENGNGVPSTPIAVVTSTLRVAPTVAAYLGITKPPAASGEPLVGRSR